MNELEDIERIFPKKIYGMEELNCHACQKKLKTYILGKCRHRYLIIYGWQQIKNIKENV